MLRGTERNGREDGGEVLALMEEVEAVAAEVALTLAGETHTSDGIAGGGSHISSRYRARPQGLEKRHST